MLQPYAIARKTMKSGRFISPPGADHATAAERRRRSPQHRRRRHSPTSQLGCGCVEAEARSPSPTWAPLPSASLPSRPGPSRRSRHADHRRSQGHADRQSRCVTPPPESRSSVPHCHSRRSALAPVAAAIGRSPPSSGSDWDKSTARSFPLPNLAPAAAAAGRPPSTDVDAVIVKAGAWLFTNQAAVDVFRF